MLNNKIFIENGNINQAQTALEFKGGCFYFYAFNLLIMKNMVIKQVYADKGGVINAMTKN